MENKQVKEEKVTNKKALEFVLTTYGDKLPKEVKEKLENMVVQLEKKSSAPKKPNKNQLENEKLCEMALETLSTTEKMTASDVLKNTSYFKEQEFSTQKVSALLKILVDTDKAIKMVDKGRSYFLKK